MLFSSMLFLWLFLPIVFVLYRVLPSISSKNALLLISSLIFYAWGEPKYIVLMVFSILMNWFWGLLIDRLKESSLKKRLVLTAAVTANLLLLGYFKYFDMVIGLTNTALGASLPMKNIALPIGISFYTFQILSYVIDLYRGEIELQKNPFKLGLYISFFPQLIAGPIVNYRDVASAIDNRRSDLVKTAYGIKRFIYGLGKKVIISNQLASAADSLYAIDLDYVPAAYLWLAVLLYTFQIYFDFSGYSDMAIGLGKMFGFDFLENFEYPYISRSITEFWRRWHISLSSWFREYVYIPLGGNRKGKIRTFVNLGIVFFLTGLWHGAGLCFIAWGLWHGLFMIIERVGFKKKLDNSKFPLLNHLYTMLVVMIGWVFFRVGSLSKALRALFIMFTMRSGNAMPLQMFVGPGVLVILAAAILLCGPLQTMMPRLQKALYNESETGWLQIIALILILLVSITFLVSGTYNPFIYFRF